jgi:hypothetical protein
MLKQNFINEEDLLPAMMDDDYEMNHSLDSHFKSISAISVPDFNQNQKTVALQNLN